MEQKISIFGRSYSLQFFEEVISNQQARQIILQASQRGTSPNFDIQKMRRTVDQRIESLVEIGTFQHFLKKEAYQQEKTEAYELVAKKFPIQLVVRGDGNCFYRSFIVNYIFKIVFYQLKEELFQFIAKIWNFKQLSIQFEFNQVQINSDEFKILAIRFLFDAFMKKASNQMNVISFIQTYNNQPEVDVSFVVICRNFINKCFKLNKRNPSKIGFIEEQDLQEIPVLLQTYGSEAQNTIIPLAANAFNNSVLNFQNLYRDQATKKFLTRLDIYNDLSSKNVQNQLNVDVLFTQGHYNVVFDQIFCQLHCQNILEQKKDEQKSIIQSVSDKILHMFIPNKPEQNLIHQNYQFNNGKTQNQGNQSQQIQNNNLVQENNFQSSNQNQRVSNRSLSNSQSKLSQSSSSSKLKSRSQGVKHPFEISSQNIPQNSIDFQNESKQNSNQVNFYDQNKNTSQNNKPIQSYQVTNYIYSPSINLNNNKKIQQTNSQSSQHYQNNFINDHSDSFQQTNQNKFNSNQISLPASNSHQNVFEKPKNNQNQQKQSYQSINFSHNPQTNINNNQQINQKNSYNSSSQRVKNIENLNILENQSSEIPKSNNINQNYQNQEFSFFSQVPVFQTDEQEFINTEKTKQIKTKPVLSQRNCCDICKQSKNTYDLLYVCVCQNCLYKSFLNLKEHSLQILADLFRLVKNEKFCLICFASIPYSVSIQRENLDTINLLCGNCQQQSEEPLFFIKLLKFVQENTLQLSNVAQQQKLNYQAWEQSQITKTQNQNKLSLSYLVSLFKEKIQNQSRQNVDMYRENLKCAMRNKTDAQRDSLIEFLTQTNRFKEFCFVCESISVKSFELPLQNGGSIRLCVECIHELENIYQAVVRNNGLTYLYCSLIDQMVILHMQNQNLSYYFKIKNHCYSCLEETHFPFQVSKNFQLCFNCLSNQMEYQKNDDKLVALIKKQCKQFQKCLGCFQSVNLDDSKLDRDVYLCYVCSKYNIVKDANQKCYQVLNRVHTRHFKVFEKEICDYIIDEKENVIFLTESSSENNEASAIEQEEQDLDQLKQQILDCPKCNYQELPKRLLDSIQCSCQFENDLSNKTTQISEGEKVFCLFCHNYLNNLDNNLSYQSLSAKSIIQYFDSQEIDVKYYFKRKIKLVRCSNCKHLQSIQEQYENYLF
ncbi:hypothetical protein TTHERM_00008590 (macronuclear) [Tetrahymena thermophila SB210]|uniref:ubiquitinyl hydrolase 1 n=1 Tax=Tetrahymena thermophila (strain SB210) TaxID=312017 RepID=Q22S75_TETTS|nr:hypothetical protein TTHERM_00008590 [Tetrahymena thermophila SB210]EAR87897.2 hypothetical protein TTHERM_00008590 [Tetrahymena thermophila SB210]|eukprot:XP_001008142.2 hypothetical protein TTHERM_00008590 [Tetrahymena thermophila SB210]